LNRVEPVVSGGGEAEQQHHLKVTTMGILTQISDEEEKGSNQENVNPVDPGTLALLDFSIGAIQVVQKHDDPEAHQGVKDEGGNLLPKESDEEKGGTDKQGVEQMILKLGQHPFTSTTVRL